MRSRRLHHLRSCSTTSSELPDSLQALHDVDHAPHVARMQADRRLVEHEQRVDQRRAERRRQIDPLHFAAGQRARLPIEREIAETDVEQELRRLRISRSTRSLASSSGAGSTSRSKNAAQRSIGNSISS
jgi:hypothetical protein